MTLTFNQIENLLLQKENESTPASIILAYYSLKQIENTENHSWYFKRGMQSKLEKMASLKKNFEELRTLFNESSVDAFIDKLNEAKSHFARFNLDDMNSVERMARSIVNSNVVFFKELIGLKAKTDTLMPIDYYLDDPEALLLLIE